MQIEIDWTFIENLEENRDSGKVLLITLEFINTFFSHMNNDHVPLTFVLSMNLSDLYCFLQLLVMDMSC